jgi:hypothetical protein
MLGRVEHCQVWIARLRLAEEDLRLDSGVRPQGELAPAQGWEAVSQVSL